MKCPEGFNFLLAQQKKKNKLKMKKKNEDVKRRKILITENITLKWKEEEGEEYRGQGIKVGGEGGG